MVLEMKPFKCVVGFHKYKKLRIDPSHPYRSLLRVTKYKVCERCGRKKEMSEEELTSLHRLVFDFVRVNDKRLR